MSWKSPKVIEIALGAEIIGGLDQTGAEELLPEPIHLDTSSERVLRTDEPVGEIAGVGSGPPEPGDIFGGLADIPAIVATAGSSSRPIADMPRNRGTSR